MTQPLKIPDTVSFEAAIALTQTLMAAMENHQISEEHIQEAIAQLVATQNGARGFFVTYLTDDRPLTNQASQSVIQALQTSPDIVAELLVKNLAMSSAIAVAHRRNHHDDLAQGSDRVRSRTHHLIQQLDLPLITEKAQQLQDSINGDGVYSNFLDRWGYDDEQRQVIDHAITAAIAPERDFGTEI